MVRRGSTGFVAVALAAGGVAGCAVVMALLVGLRIGVSVAVPWWMAVLAPVVVYGVVVAASFTGTSLGSKALALAGMGAAHATVTLAGAIAAAGVAEVTLTEGFLEAGARFLPAPLLLLFAVPLVLTPLRPLLPTALGPPGEHASGSRGQMSPPDARPETVPGWYAWPRDERKSAEPATAGEFHAPVQGFLTPAAEAPAPLGLLAATRPAAERVAAPRSVTTRLVDPHEPAPPPSTAPPRTPVASAVPAPRRVEPSAPPPLTPPPPTTAVASPTVPVVPSPPRTVSAPPAALHAPDSIRGQTLDTEAPPLFRREAAASGQRGPEPSRAEGEPHPGASPPGRDAHRGDMISIAFDHVATQLPAEAFSVALDRLGASLLDPGRLLVPRDILLPQLAEGEVTVAWADVADQFPADALVVPRSAVGERLPQGRLALPLAEVFAQLPPEVFALSSAEVDVSGIHAFPVPFQPVPPVASAVEAPPPTSWPSAAVPVPMPSSSDAVAPEEPMATVEPPVPALPVEEQGTPAAPGSAAEGEAVEPAPAEAGEPGSGPGEGRVEAQEKPAPAEAGDSVSKRWDVRVEAHEEAPGVQEDAPSPALRDVSRQEALEISELLPASCLGEPGSGGPMRLDGDGGRVTMRYLAARLAPIGALEADVVTLDGVRLYTFLAPALPTDGVMTLTARLLGLLDPGRAPWPVDQLTLRLEDAAVVLTPVGEALGLRLVVVAAIPRGGSLAMLEMLSKQGAGERRTATNGSALNEVAVGDEGDTRLHEVPAGPAQRHVAGTLGGLGRLVPTVFRAEADGLELSLFVDPDEDAHAVGRFAHRVYRAVADHPMPTGFGPLRSVAARTGERRLVLMPADGAPRRWTALLTAAAEPARPGLVRLHAERAAARLAAS